MRTILIETVRPEDTEITVGVTKDPRELEFLIEQGLDVRELLTNEVTEFLSPIGTQFRVTFLGENTFVSFRGGVA